MILKWQDKKQVSFISSFHDSSMETPQRRGKEIRKPKCVRQYNKFMGGVDLKDQKLQPYLIERKRCVKWYMKLFRRLMNTAVHNSLIIYNTSENKKMDHLNFRIQLVKELLETHGRAVETRQVGRPSKTPMPERITAHHFIERIPSTEKKAKPYKRCIVCCKSTKKGRKQHTGVRNVELGFV